MNKEEALLIVKKHLTAHRFEHTKGVLSTALELGKKRNLSKKKIELASIFHDYAKFRPKAEMRALIKEKELGNDFLQYGSELLHAPCGAYWVEHEVGIKDEEVLQAIRYHTTGRPKMTDLEKIIFIADYIEPNRQFPGVEAVRKVAQENLDEACIMALKNTIQFLLTKNQAIYPDTLATYNDFILNKREKEEKNERK